MTQVATLGTEPGAVWGVIAAQAVVELNTAISYKAKKKIYVRKESSGLQNLLLSNVIINYINLWRKPEAL